MSHLLAGPYTLNLASWSSGYSDGHASGYRDYSDDAAARLGFIQAAQSIGFSLGEIRETLAFRDRGEAPCCHVAALIERNAEQLRVRIVRLQEMRRELLLLAEKARAAAPEDHSGAAFCHIIEG